MKTLFFLLFATSATACTPDYAKLLNAIRKSEGTWTYGVNVPVRTEAEARRVAYRTLLHYHQDWNHRGSFISYVASRYCPKSVDPVGHRNWIKNVTYYVKKS